MVEGKDTFRRVAAFHRLRNGAEVAFGDEVADVRGVHHHFHGDYPAGAVRARKEALGDEAVQVFCKFRLDLVALLTREEVVNPFQRLYGVGGVQGRETQVTGFGEVHRVLHGIDVADFPDEDDVRRLTQRVFQRGAVGGGVNADFTLDDHGFFRLVHEFDRVFDGDDVVAGVFVAVIDHRGQRGGFTVTGRPDDDNQAALDHGDFFQNVRHRQFEVVQFRNHRRNQTQHEAGNVFLQVNVNPQVGNVRHFHHHVQLVRA